MKALVTGGTGFVGGHLVRQLCEQGDTVRALVRPTSNLGGMESLSVEPVVGDLDEIDSLRRACEGCDIVYHSAARVDMVGTKEEFHRTTVAGTEHLLDAAARQGVRRFVHVSSCGVYHPKLFGTGQIINEFTPTPEPPTWFPYGRAKLRAERSVQEQCPPDMEWIIIRLGYLYGPGNRAMHTHVAPAMRDTTMRIIGDGQNEMAFVYVADAVRAVVLAGRCPDAAGRILIAGCNEWITQQRYFDAMADGFGIPRVKKHIPYSVAYFFGWLGEKLFRSGPRHAVLRRAAIALTGLPQRLRCDYTQKLLNWEPKIKFEDGIRKAYDWYHREYGQSSK